MTRQFRDFHEVFQEGPVLSWMASAAAPSNVGGHRRRVTRIKHGTSHGVFQRQSLPSSGWDNPHSLARAFRSLRTYTRARSQVWSFTSLSAGLWTEMHSPNTNREAATWHRRSVRRLRFTSDEGGRGGEYAFVRCSSPARTGPEWGSCSLCRVNGRPEGEHAFPCQDHAPWDPQCEWKRRNTFRRFSDYQFVELLALLRDVFIADL